MTIEFPVDVLLATVTEVELNAVLAEARSRGCRPTLVHGPKVTYHDLGVVQNARIFVVQTEMGSVGPGAATSTVQMALNDTRAHTVLAVGIAFGLQPSKQRIGDVLVAQQVQLYEPQRIGTSSEGHVQFVARGQRASATPRIIQRIRAARTSVELENLDSHFGLIVSGEKLVDNAGFVERLQAFAPEAIGGDMEIGGIQSAAHGAEVGWAGIKAICDWGDGFKHEQKHERQQFAARNAARVAFVALCGGGFEREASGPTGTREGPGPFARLAARLRTPNRSRSLLQKHPLLHAAAHEIAEERLTHATWEAVLDQVPPVAVQEFLLFVFEKFRRPFQQGLAFTSSLELVVRHGLGHDVVERCLASGRLEGYMQRSPHLASVKEPADAVWAHGLFVQYVRDDAHYNTLLGRHGQTLLRSCPEAVAAYLLHPDRGPAMYNIDSMFHCLQNAPTPRAYVERIRAWLITGQFEPPLGATGAPPRLLYLLHQDTVQRMPERADLVTPAILERVYGLVRTHDEIDALRACAHLLAQLEVGWKCTPDLLERLSDLWLGPYSEPVILAGRCLDALANRHGVHDLDALEREHHRLWEERGF